MFYGILFTLPTTSDILVSIGEVSTPIFSDFWPIVTLVLGLVLVFVVIRVLFGFWPGKGNH